MACEQELLNLNQATAAVATGMQRMTLQCATYGEASPECQ